MSAEVVDTNPYSRLMALQRMGVVKVGCSSCRWHQLCCLVRRVGKRGSRQLQVVPSLPSIRHACQVLNALMGGV